MKPLCLSFPVTGGLDWWFGGSGRFPIYPLQEPDLQGPKPAIQTTNLTGFLHVLLSWVPGDFLALKSQQAAVVASISCIVLLIVSVILGGELNESSKFADRWVGQGFQFYSRILENQFQRTPPVNCNKRKLKFRENAWVTFLS